MRMKYAKKYYVFSIIKLKLCTMAEELQSDTKIKSKKTSFKKNVNTANVDSDDYSEMPDKHQLPALLDETPVALGNRLKRIEEQLLSIYERQKSGVSAEFSALMDGYVNKANESQEFKVKFENIFSQYEELKIEFKTQREENKKLKLDMDAAKEALRSSETELQRNRKDSENNKLRYDEQISDLIQEREKLKTKLKQLMDHQEKSAVDYNDLKAELLEFKYKTKQLEQEKEVEVETAKRSVRESNKIIDELKEKLDLRTREVEYKDALLNQLIKQVSAEESLHDVVGEGLGHHANEYPRHHSYEELQERPKPRSEIRIEDSNDGPSWGAFRK